MTIRQAQNTQPDRDLIFNLSNDPLVRSVSFNQNKIEYADHCKWYEKTLADKNTLFFLVFADETEQDFVGQIRFKRNSEQAEECVVSLSMTEQFRGKGVSANFIELGIKELRKNWGNIKTVVAEVKDENIASNKLFLKEGFRLVLKVNTYELDIMKHDGGGYKCRVLSPFYRPFHVQTLSRKRLAGRGN